MSTNPLADIAVPNAPSKANRGNTKKGNSWFQKTCADLGHGNTISKSSGEGGILRAIVEQSSLLWENGKKITYRFLSGNEIQQKKVESVVGRWAEHANVKFEHTDSEDAIIRITFDPRSSSWCYVGTDILNVPAGQATTNLGWVEDQSPEPSERERGTILHAFGHILGLGHEHAALTLNEDAVYSYYKSSVNWDKDRVKSEIIDVYSGADVSNYTKLDTTSVMSLFMPAAMNTEQKDILPNDELSKFDKAFAVIHYPPHPSAPSVLSDALDTFGVSGDAKKVILEVHKNDPTGTKVRNAFIAWNAARGDTGRETPSARSSPSEIVKEISTPTTPWCGSQPVETPSEPVKGLDVTFAKGISLLWNPGYSIRYHFQQPESAHKYRKETFRSYLSYIQTIVNINFQEVPEEADTDVRVYFDDVDADGASWSRIGDGKEVGGKDRVGGLPTTTMRLKVPAARPSAEDDLKDEKRSYLHELGHVLGLLHGPYNTKTTSSKTNSAIGIFSPWDPASIMFHPDSSLDDGTTTVYNNDLSQIDKAFWFAMYPSEPTTETLSSVGLAGQLVKLGIKSGDVEELLGLRASAFSRKGVCDPTKITAYRRKVGDKLYSPTPDPPYEKLPANPLPGPEKLPEEGDGKALASNDPFLATLVKSLKKFFNPGGGQIFTLQFPGRFLQMSEYAWDTSDAGIHGQFVKPVTVNENEFRLVDQLYDVAEVVGGPNGVNLSLVYEQLLNNLLPCYQPPNLAKQQNEIRKWLLRDVKVPKWIEDIINGTNRTSALDASPTNPADGNRSEAPFVMPVKLTDGNIVTRMELSNALMMEYLEAKQAWELERDRKMEEALKIPAGTPESAAALNSLARELAHITTVREAQLAAKYNDAVVRGFSHNVREYVGYMDIKSPSEALQDAKDSLREARMSSVDGAMRVYPVKMTPIDWFESLSTSFTLEDLTSDPSLILDQIQARARQLDVLQSQLVALQYGTKGNVDELEAQVDEARDNLSNAQTALTTQFSSNVINLAQSCIEASGKFNPKQLDGMVKDKRLQIAEAALTSLKAGMEEVATAQQSLESASRAMSQVLTARALAHATDTAMNQEKITLEMRSIQRELDELKSRYQSLNTGDDGPKKQDTDSKSIDEVDVLTPANETSGGSRWQEIVMHNMVTSDYSESHSSASSTVSKSHCNLWFASSSSSFEKSQGESKTTTSKMTNEVWVGFRATMVTVDRGGWFQPQFFKQSQGFFHINEKVTWSKWPDNVKTMSQLKEGGSDKFDQINKGLLPAFPVSYIICKDITVKVKYDASESSDKKSYMSKSSSSSGGVLCWSYSSSSSSTSEDNSHSFQSYSDGVIVRIPGPQVLGYIMQLTDNDETEPMPTSLPPDFFIPDSDYDNAVQDSGSGTDPSEVAKSEGGDQAKTFATKFAHNPNIYEKVKSILEQNGVAQSTLKNVHEALESELAAVSADVSARVLHG